jgi:hypothetical protein
MRTQTNVSIAMKLGRNFAVARPVANVVNLGMPAACAFDHIREAKPRRTTIKITAEWMTM